VSTGTGRTATDFRLAFRKLQSEYQTTYGPKVAEVRAVLADPRRKSPELEETLEAHVFA